MRIVKREVQKKPLIIFSKHIKVKRPMRFFVIKIENLHIRINFKIIRAYEGLS